MSLVHEDHLDVEVVEQKSPLLGRNKVHDTRSRAFAATTMVDRSTWRTKMIRLYEPTPNPNQTVGCCTGVAKCNQLNAYGNRVKGRVLNLKDAERIYHENTIIDPWPGVWPPDDTGSSGLASAKTAQKLGLGGEYRWIFNGADGVIQEIMQGRTVSVGTWWYWDMFDKSQAGLIGDTTGGLAGGHQYIIRGYYKTKDWVLGRCWWGPEFRDFYMPRTQLDELLRDGGDAHFQATT
jgi:hypothetical protein